VFTLVMWVPQECFAMALHGENLLLYHEMFLKVFRKKL
jgi:hypothetical protein